MKIVATLPDASRHEVIAKPGGSVMTSLRAAGLAIRAECGGAMACATCHIYVEGSWLEATGRAIGEESELLDMSDHRSVHSRLACQIRMTDALDGLQLALQPDAFEG